MGILIALYNIKKIAELGDKDLAEDFSQLFYVSELRVDIFQSISTYMTSAKINGSSSPKNSC